MSTPAGNQQTEGNNWRQIVTSLYPDALTQTYCVPPVHFNRVPYERIHVPGTGHSALQPLKPGAAPAQNVPQVSQRPVPPSRHSLWTQESQPQVIPDRVQESDLQDDLAQSHVMLNLQKIATSHKEVMFILSQLSFGNYLNQPAYAAAAAELPRLSQIDTKKIKYSHGEADFVLIHHYNGILIGELKSIGRNQADVNNPQPPADADVAKRVTKAVKQLDRSETVVRHLVSDVARLTVRKTIFLPYVSTEQLQRVLDNDQQLKQAVCQSLGADTTAKAVQLCCCSDQFSQPTSYWDVTPDVLSQLSTWWQQRMPCTPDTQLTDEQYLDIVARFVGPATTVSVPCYNGVRVEVRTLGQAVAELGRRLALLVLTLQQLDLMNRDPPRVCITGPPGTGKTVVLVLQALRWLLQGNDVQVISTRYSSRAVNALITDLIQGYLDVVQTASQIRGKMFYHPFDFYKREADTDTAIKELEACEKDGKLFVLIDEAHFIARDDAGKRHTKLISELTQSVPELHLWAACVQHIDIPKELQHEEFTVPLRCAPVIQRVITPAVKMVSKQVREYTDCGVPAPGDGPRVVELSHHGNDHTGQWPAECNKCGKEVAAELRRLDVGRAGGTLTNSPAALSYRDVFILTRSSELHDDVKDDAGNITSPASGVVRGLRDAGVPVCVLALQDAQQNKSQEYVKSVALGTEDEVTVTHYGDVQGLERRVVVVLQGKTNVADKHRRKNDIDVVDILDAVSRCTTQLIVVKKEEKMCVVL